MMSDQSNLMSILETSSDAVVLVDEDGDILDLGEEACSWFGLTDCVGKEFATVFPSGERILRSCDDHSISVQSPHGGENSERGVSQSDLISGFDGVELVLGRGVDKDHYMIRSEWVAGEKFLVLFFDEVTQWCEFESSFYALLRLVSESAGVVSKTGDIDRFVPSSRFEVHQSPRINADSNLFDAVHPDDECTLTELLQTAVDENTLLTDCCRFSTYGYGWQEFEVCVGVVDSLPSENKVVFIAKSVDDHQKFEERRQVTNRILRHNLRNDMNVIKGYAQILAEETDGENTNKAEKILEKSESLIEISDEVRTVDQQLFGTNRSLHAVHISDIVRSVIDEVHEDNPDIVLRSKIDDVYIMGDELIRIAVYNLLENAIQHNDSETPKIRVEVEERLDDDRVDVSVIDNGSGMNEGVRTTIRNESETALQHLSGLGLWLVKWIINRMDGSMSIEDNTPSGTSITLSLVSADSDRLDFDPESDVRTLDSRDRLDQDYNGLAQLIPTDSFDN